MKKEVMQMKKIIILITVDTLRADVCGFAGSEKSFTPNLDSLFESYGVSYTQAFASGTPTYTSFPGIMCGLFPSEMKNNLLPKETKTLAEIMKSKGYNTAAVVASNPFLTTFQGYDRGFDEFITIGHKYDSFLKSKKPGVKRTNELDHHTPFSHKVRRKLNSYLRRALSLITLLTTGERHDDNASMVFEKANEVIHEARFPLFIWIHLMDVHSPYRLPETRNRLQRLYFYRQRRKCTYHALNVDKRVLDDLLLMYHESVRYMDMHTASFVRTMIAQFGNEASIILTSDHGEEFMERGHLQHTNNPFIEVARVPYIHFDFNNRSRKIKDLFSLADTSKHICSIAENKLETFSHSRPFVMTEVAYLEKPRIKLQIPFTSYIMALRSEETTLVFYQGEMKVYKCSRVTDRQEIECQELSDNKALGFFKEYANHQNRKALLRAKPSRVLLDLKKKDKLNFKDSPSNNINSEERYE